MALTIRFFLLLFLLCFFLISVHVRMPLFGSIPTMPLIHDTSFRSLTILAVSMANNWLHYGPWQSGFLLDNLPAGPDLLCCAIYSSYPSGFLIPPYLIGWFTGTTITVELLMALSLFYHFAIAALITWFCFVCIAKEGAQDLLSYLLALASGLLTIFLPASLLFFQNVWWPDLAVLLPFAAVIFLEALNRRGVLQAIILFIGIITDWLFVPLVFIILGKRLWMGRKSSEKKPNNTRLILISSFFAAIYVVYTLWESGNPQALVEKFLERSSFGPDGGDILKNTAIFWKVVAKEQIQWIGVWILCGAFLFALYRVTLKKASPLDEALFLVLSSALIHSLILNQHYAAHTYNGIKLIIPLALLPAYYFSFFIHSKPLRLPALFFALAFVLLYLGITWPLFKKSYSDNQSLSASTVAAAKFIRKQASYDEVIFSNYLSIEPVDNLEDPVANQAIAVSQKLVHKVKNIADVRSFITSRRQEYSIFLDPEKLSITIFGLYDDKEVLQYWQKFAKKLPRREANFYLLELDKNVYDKW